MSRQSIPGNTITLQVKFYENGTLFDPLTVNDVKIFDVASGGTALTTLTTVRVSTGLYRVTWAIPAAQTEGTYYDEWAWQGVNGMVFKTQRNTFWVGGPYTLYPVAQEVRIEVIETSLNTIQTAMNKFATKAQLKALLTIRQNEITDMQTQITQIEETGYANALQTHRTDTGAHSNLANYYNKTEFVNSSAGAADTTKPVVLNFSGKIDNTMLEATMNTLTDVSAASPNTSDLLQYNGVNWVTVPASGLVAAEDSLDELTDVNLTGASNKQFLQHNGTEWVNTTNLDVNGDVTVSGQAILANGSMSAPTLRWQGVSNAGIYLHAPTAGGVLGFSVNGNQRLTLSQYALTFNSCDLAMGAPGTEYAYLLFEKPTATNPVILPKGADATTGIGAAYSGSISMIVSGIEQGRWDVNGLLCSGLSGFTPTNDIDPPNVLLMGANAYSQATTNLTGGDLVLAPGIGRKIITIVDYSLLDSGVDTIIINSNTANDAFVATKTETFTAVSGVASAFQFKFETSNAVTATNLAAAITTDSVAATAVAVSNIVYVSPRAGVTVLDLSETCGNEECTITESNNGRVIIGGTNNTNAVVPALYFDDSATASRIRAYSGYIYIDSGGSGGWQFYQASSFSSTNLGAQSFGILQEVASATNPVFVPRFGDQTTGFGAASAGVISNIVSGVEIGRWSETGLQVNGVVHFGTEYDNGNSGAADTIDWNNNLKQKSTLTDDATYTFTDPPGVCNLTLKLVQDATGSRLATWPASVLWPAATAPTLTTTASGIDIVSFYYDGTNYFGQAGLDFS